MKYLSSYVQAPTSPPASSNQAAGTAQAAHRRQNKAGGWSQAAVISNLSFPTTLTYQGYNDPGELQADQILVRTSPTGPWRVAPLSPGNTATVPASLPTTWATVGDAELAGNQASLPLNSLDFGTFSSASEPSSTFWLVNDGQDTVETLSLVIRGATGQTPQTLDNRVRVAINGLLGTVGVGNLVTTYNQTMQWGLGNPNSLPLVLPPNSAASITITLVNFPATGLPTQDLEAEFLFTPNASGASLPVFVDWPVGALRLGPDSQIPLVTDDPAGPGVLLQPYEVRVGGVVYSASTPTAFEPGAGDHVVYLDVQGNPATRLASTQAPSGSVDLASFTLSSGGSISAYRTLAGVVNPRLWLPQDALLTEGKAVGLNSSGKLIHQSPGLGVSGGGGYFVTSGITRFLLGSQVNQGDEMQAGLDQTWGPGLGGPAVALEDGQPGQLVLGFLKPASGGSGGGGGGPVVDGVNQYFDRISLDDDGNDQRLLIPRASATLAGLMSGDDFTKLNNIVPPTSFNVTFTRTANSVTLTSHYNTPQSVPMATPSLAGMISGADKAKLDGLGSGGGSTNLGYTTSATNGLVTSSTGTSATLPLATTTLAGLMAPGQVVKLDGIQAGAQANVATDLAVTRQTGSVTVTSSTGTSAVLPLVSSTQAGLMASTDKTKLDGVQTGAQANVATDLAVTRQASTLTVTSSTGTSAVLPVATTTQAGLMTGGQVTQLSGLSSSTANLTFSGGWGNFNNGYGPLKVTKFGPFVFVEGVITGPALGIVAIVPAGFRPTTAVRSTCECSGGFVAAYTDNSGQLGLQAPSPGASPTAYTTISLLYST